VLATGPPIWAQAANRATTALSASASAASRDGTVVITWQYMKPLTP
jgi:hypothetical protein